MTELVVRETSIPGTGWVDATGEEVAADPLTTREVDRVARELARWSESTRGRTNRPTMFDRAAYVTPDSPYAQMMIARNAVEGDDIVGGVADIQEGLMFQGVAWESPDVDDTDVFNQINRDLQMDQLLRIINRDLFTYSQAVVGSWWGRRTYTVRGRTEGGEGRRTRRRKAYSLLCPVRMMLLDPMRVVPMPPTFFGYDRLAWHATEHEFDSWDSVVRGESDDLIMRYFLDGPVEGLSMRQQEELQSWGLDPHRLLWLNPNAVTRITRTKASYERFPANRLKAVFPLLDLKQQLIESDRVNLVGAANYILLVKKGTDEMPAKQEEISNLKIGMSSLAKLPVIVGDHRLEIEIITPKQDQVLRSERYDALDGRILNRTLGLFDIDQGGREGSATMVARAVARQLDGQRLMVRRMLEERLARAVVEHPANVDPQGRPMFRDEPNLAFTPRNINLDADGQVVQALLALRTQKEISRQTIHEHFGLDQEVEATRRETEAERYDDIFHTQVPFTAPGVSSDQTGRQGGRPPGGGESDLNPEDQAKPRSGSGGNPSTRRPQ